MKDPFKGSVLKGLISRSDGLSRSYGAAEGADLVNCPFMDSECEGITEMRQKPPTAELCWRKLVTGLCS